MKITLGGLIRDNILLKLDFMSRLSNCIVNTLILILNFPQQQFYQNL